MLISTFAFGQQNNKSTLLQLNQEITDLKISRNEEQNFNLNLKKDTYYSILASQQGIDLVVTLKDKKGKSIKEVDTSNGKFGPEKIVFSPDNSDNFSISVKPLDDKSNSQTGKYSIVLKEITKILKNLSSKELIQDFEILQNAYYETKVGLWYNSRLQFDSICNIQKSKIKDNISSLDFYRIVAPIVAFTDEGHSHINMSDELKTYFTAYGKFMPIFVKILNEKIYVINDLDKIKGFQITKINGKSIDNILATLLSIEPADGYNKTSKYRWIETKFSKYYSFFIEQSETYELELINPRTNEKIVYNTNGVSNKEFEKQYSKLTTSIPNYEYKEVSTFKIDKNHSTATLTINSFNSSKYKDEVTGFENLLEKSFISISELNIKNLIIDIRKNEGGDQGMEDILLSYLIEKEYTKYKYVEIPAFTFSFLKYTDYKNEDDILMKELKKDFYQINDGRFLDIEGRFFAEKPKPNNFKGNVYILVGGLTFSGGSEFASLAKNYTNAKYIGEEVGGGFYGNTSGKFLKLTLPNTELMVRIPLHKFAIVNTKNNIPFGHGVLPDFTIQPTIEEYINGFDAEMEYTKKLISK
jgi:hypothetical protein